MPCQLCCEVSACHTWASHSGFQHTLTPLGTKGTTGGLGRKGSFRLILALEWFLAIWTLLSLFYRQTFGVWVVLAFPP